MKDPFQQSLVSSCQNNHILASQAAQADLIVHKLDSSRAWQVGQVEFQKKERQGPRRLKPLSSGNDMPHKQIVAKSKEKIECPKFDFSFQKVPSTAKHQQENYSVSKVARMVESNSGLSKNRHGIVES